MPTHIISVGGLVYNRQNKILLVKNPRRGWEFPGGQVENGETLTQALAREIKEESGIDAKIIKMVGIYSKITPRKGYNGIRMVPTQLNIDFICRYISGKLTVSNETIDLGWFGTDEWEKLVTHEIYKIRIKNMLSNSKTIYYYAYNNEYEIKEKRKL